MIVRLNQLDLANVEKVAGWGNHSLCAGVEYDWPGSARAFEILILPADEHNQALPEDFRQAQLRRLIPDIAAALAGVGEELVVRLDGPMLAGELVGAFAWLTETTGAGRFSVSHVQKLTDGPEAVVCGSVRLAPSARALEQLCNDAQVGLQRGVRLRIYSVREELVNPLLDVDELEDERWGEILDQAGFVLSTSRGLGSLVLVTRSLGADETRSRITKRLAGGGKA